MSMESYIDLLSGRLESGFHIGSAHQYKCTSKLRSAVDLSPSVVLALRSAAPWGTPFSGKIVPDQTNRHHLISTPRVSGHAGPQRCELGPKLVGSLKGT